MNDLKYMITICRRPFAEHNVAFCRSCGIEAVHINLCHGTASQSMLDFLGLEDTDKIMLQMMATRENARKYTHGLVYKMGIDSPGSGISVVVPVGSIGGAASMKYMTDGQNPIIGEVNEMNEMNYALIVVIAEGGSSDLVMDAARSAGARGGTVVSGKGTGTQFTTKFFGVSIAAEKDLIYIVAKHRDKDAIMRAIMEKAGMHSDAHAAVFTLPVEDVVGLHSVTDDEN